MLCVSHDDQWLLQVTGSDMSPGLKKGGHLNFTTRVVLCAGPAAQIPSAIEVDVSTLDFGQRIYLANLSIPPGVSILGLVSSSILNNTACTSFITTSSQQRGIVACVDTFVLSPRHQIAFSTVHAGGSSTALQSGRACKPRLMVRSSEFTWGPGAHKLMFRYAQNSMSTPPRF